MTAGYTQQTIHGVVVSIKLVSYSLGNCLSLYLYLPIYLASKNPSCPFRPLSQVEQIIPDQELPFVKLKAKWLPSIEILVSIAASFFTTDFSSHLPTIVFGTYTGWLYL
ncbi:hypothetical protein Leryth_012453 [Lithospermum erythrorhizon]|nr:hypothetical protein Leryth_012453 [Lithospermum erythrorhizon]